MAELTKDDLKLAFEKLQLQTRVYKENKEYVKGCNPEILKEQRKKDPDNRIPVPLAKSVVEDMTGYAGSEIEVMYNPVDVVGVDKTEYESYKKIMRTFQTYNDDDLITTQLYKEALSHREVYLLTWVSNKLNLDGGLMTAEYSVIGMNEMIVMWDNSLKPKMLAAVHFVKEGESMTATVYYPGEEEKAGEGETEVTIKTDGYSKGWIKRPKEESWEPYTELDSMYPFKEVPVVVFKIDYDGGPLFQAEKPLIDKHDGVISKSQNEIDRFNALIALFPGQVDSKFIKKLEEMKALDELNQYERWPEYLEKNMAGVTEYTNQHLDRLERLFHKTVKVVDFNQLTAQGGDESGVARAFKLLGMEFKATEIEKIFNKGFYKRTELFNDIINVSTIKIDTAKYTTHVSAKRNLPVDEANKLVVAQGLRALGVSDKTILEMLPMIKDIDKELDEMKKAKEERAKQFNNVLNENNEE